MSEIVISRVLDVARKTAFDAWTKPEQLKKWWGPKDYTCPSAKIDARPGGKLLLAMRDPKGKDSWSTGEFRELTAPAHFVASDSFADAEGNIVPASYYGMDDWPMTTTWDVTFEEVGPKKTKMTVRHQGLPQGELAKQCEAGWNQSLDKFENVIGKERSAASDSGNTQPQH